MKLTKLSSDKNTGGSRETAFEEGGDTPRANGGAVQTDEHRLVESARQGEGQAFEQLYRLHVGRTYALCLRMSRNVTVAEELTQECFVHAWKKLAKFKGESSFGTWFHRLSVNVILGRFRQRSRRAARVVSVEDVDMFAVRARTEMTGERMDLDAAIKALPERARIVFVLFEKEGFQHQEIGKMLGISAGTSKAHLHRARKFLRECLK